MNGGRRASFGTRTSAGSTTWANAGPTMTAGAKRGWGGFFFEAEGGIRDLPVTGVQTCALPILRRLGRHLAELVPADTQVIAARELGAVLLGGAVSMQMGLPLVLVRKEPKEYGTGKQVEGRFEAGRRVTVIEDVVTTGGDSLRTVEVLRNAQLEVIRLVVVLDRGEGGAENIRQAGRADSPLLRLSHPTPDLA